MAPNRTIISGLSLDSAKLNEIALKEILEVLFHLSAMKIGNLFARAHA